MSTFLKLDTAIAGHRHAFQEGDVVEWPDDAEAQRLQDAGQATILAGPKEADEAAARNGKPVRQHRKVEKAVRKQAPEKATL